MLVKTKSWSRLREPMRAETALAAGSTSTTMAENGSGQHITPHFHRSCHGFAEWAYPTKQAGSKAGLSVLAEPYPGPSPGPGSTWLGRSALQHVHHCAAERRRAVGDM